jgi:hypothetical protein
VKKHRIYKNNFYWYFQCGLCQTIQVRANWEGAKFAGTAHIIARHRHTWKESHGKARSEA